MSLRLRRVVGGGYLLPSVTRRPVTPGRPGPRTGPFGACSRSLHAPAAPRPHPRCDAASRWSLTISALLSFCLDTRFPLCFPIRILWTVAPARCRRSQSIDPPHEPAHSLLVYFVVSMLCVAHISRFPRYPTYPLSMFIASPLSSSPSSRCADVRRRAVILVLCLSLRPSRSSWISVFCRPMFY